MSHETIDWNIYIAVAAALAQPFPIEDARLTKDLAERHGSQAHNKSVEELLGENGQLTCEVEDLEAEVKELKSKLLLVQAQEPEVGEKQATTTPKQMTLNGYQDLEKVKKELKELKSKYHKQGITCQQRGKLIGKLNRAVGRLTLMKRGYVAKSSAPTNHNRQSALPNSPGEKLQVSKQSAPADDDLDSTSHSLTGEILANRPRLK